MAEMAVMTTLRVRSSNVQRYPVMRPNVAFRHNKMGEESQTNQEGKQPYCTWDVCVLNKRVKVGGR